MIKLKKYSFLLISALILCFILSSCHGELKKAVHTGIDDIPTQNSDEILFELPNEFDTSKNYEISFWAKNDTNKVQTEIYEKAISDFTNLYPNIKINLKLYNDYGKIYNDVITNISTNTTPNVCITYPDHIATYISGNETVVKLDSLFDDPEYGFGGNKLKFDSPKKDEIISNYLNECRLCENYYAVPFMRSSEVCYINKTLVEKMGYTIPDKLTWDFIWEVSEKALEKDSSGNYVVNNQKVLIPFIYKSTDNMMIQMLKQLDAPYSADNGEIYIFNDETKEILKEISKHAGTRSFSTFKISSYPGNYLNANQCIFAIDSTAGSTWIGSDAPLSDLHKNQIEKFETEVKVIPQFDTENPKMISQGPSICVFNKDDPGEILASWLFVQYLLTNDIQIAYAKTEGYIPVTHKAHNSKDYIDYLSRIGEDNNTYYDVKIKASKIILENTDNTFVTPVFNGSASLRNAAGQMIENVSKSARRKETIDDKYFDSLYSDMISLFHLENITVKQDSSNKTINIDKGSSETKLPTEAYILIISIISIWVLLGLKYFKEYAAKMNRNR